MNRPATSPDVPGRADQWIRHTATITVAGLAGIAGALSYSTRRRALQHLSVGVVLVIAAALTLALFGTGSVVQHLLRDYPMLIKS